MEKMMQQHEEEHQVNKMMQVCPPWLHAAIADIEQRVRALAAGVPDDDAAADHSFAQRAENYYRRRPQLLALLTDLHHRYLYLADRYAQSLLSNANAKSSANLNAISASDCSSDVDDRSSDAGSSLSYQPHPGINAADDHIHFADLVVAELVMAWVDRDVLADEADRRRAESARKIDLQGSLLEVLESERLVLLGENARLAFRASAADEEAAAAAAELGYTRRRAADLARLAVKLRDDHRACMLGRKVEALQAQVYGLELRNRECFEAMAAWEAERKAGVGEIDRLRAENRRLAAEAAQAAAASRRKRGGKGGSGSGWWWLARVRLAAECAPSSVTVSKVGEQMKGGKYNGGCFCL
ncbi:kinase-interacting family protein-like isoform X1 [Hordeum vulgare subsp. vulgare]|uniref:NAB domain-containing protein n=1 Tax=Hordeum vulgare subsp. vulgare TaxID=112509 RepID=A0A8I7B7V3_HORVV|nr:kinase-interacting family protein-like isoform X1 [Hordeum vulgare subsp. vulgare]